MLARDATRTQRLRDQLTDPDLGETFLLTHAQTLDADRFAKLVAAWAIRTDPEAADRAWREDTGKEELSLAPTTGGYHLTGWLTTTSGQALDTALTAHMGRKSQDDQRTPNQRRAAALTGLARESLDTGTHGTSARIRPHLTVTVPWNTLRALTTTHHPDQPAEHHADPAEPHGDAADPADDGDHGEYSLATGLDYEALRGLEPATFPDGTPLAPGLLARLACGSQLSRVVFGPDSTILDVGREKRIFPANQALRGSW
nr:DUF222 domain-containing protein [Pseudactinotalea sp. HY158]